MNELPQGWILSKISDLVEKVPNYKPEEEPEREFGYIDISSVCNETFQIKEYKKIKGYEAPSRARRPIQFNDVLFSNVRTYLKNIALVPKDLDAQLCSTGFTVLRPNQAVEPGFLFRYVLTQNFIDRVTPKQTGTHYPATSDRIVLSELVPLPPLNEQRRIVAKLEKLLAKYEACKQRLDKIPGILKRFRQSILAAACSGRLTADWREQNPDVEPASELLDQVREEKRQRYKKECNEAISKGLRKPKEPIFGDVEDYEVATWRLTTLETIAEAIVDCPHSTPKWTDSGFLCVRTTQFEPFKLRLDDVKYVSEETFKDRVSRLKPRADDVLYSREGGILGIACQIPPGLELCLGQRMMLIRCNSDWLSGKYLTMLLNSEVILSQVKELITGTASPHLNVGDVKAFKIPIPPLAEQREIVRRVKELFKLADQIEQRYRQSVCRQTPSIHSRQSLSG